MDLELAPEDDPRRLQVRTWLAEHPEPSGKDLAEAGYVVPHWPKPWGLDADPMTQLLVDDELKRAKIQRPINPIGIGHCGPVLVVHGSDEHRGGLLSHRGKPESGVPCQPEPRCLLRRIHDRCLGLAAHEQMDDVRP